MPAITRRRAKRDPHGFYPGNDYVDWIGIDTYQRGPNETFDGDFGLFYSDFGNSQYGNKPLMVGENGAQNYGQHDTKLQWTYLQGLLADVQANRYPLLKAYDYFDAPGNTPPGWVLDDNNGQGNGGLAAFAMLAASPSFSPTPVEQTSREIQSVTLYVAPDGNDSWSGHLPAPNAAKTDGPFATFDHARATVQSMNKTGLHQVTVQFRGGTYFLPKTENFTSADSGSASTGIIYESYPREKPIISGGMRVQNWTDVGGNKWQASLPASTLYFENLFYNGVRRLRPRLGGYLGTYLRFAGPVYVASQQTNCSVEVNPGQWECFDRFQYNPSDPIADTWKNLAPAANNACQQPAGNTAIAGDVEVLDWEQFSTLQASRKLCGRDESHCLSDRAHRDLSGHSQPGRLHRRQSLSDREHPGRTHAAGPVVSGPLHHAVDAHLSRQPRRESQHRYGHHSAACPTANRLESAIRDVPRPDVRVRQLHHPRRRTPVRGTGA